MRSTTKLLLTSLATLTIALALLQGTGAVQLTQGDDVGQSIVLEPHPGPNGQYAYYDADDELAVDLSGSNPDVEGDGPNDDAVTAVPEVFTVTNDGDSTARVWIETAHPLVTFTARGESIEGPDRAVHLAPNESVAVGLRVVTTDDVLPDVVVDSFEVNAVVADGNGDGRNGDGRNGDDGATDGGASTGGDSGGGDSGGTDDSTADDDVDRTTTTVTSPAPNERRVTVQHPGGRVSVGLDGMHVAGANVTLDRVVLSAEGSVVEFGAVGRTASFDGLPALESDHTRADGYVRLDRERVPDSVGGVRLHVSVDSDYLDWRGADPEDVTVYRLGSDGWTALDTEVVDRGGRIHYAADAEALSSIVVATGLPAIGVTDAAVDRRRVAPGEPVTVTAGLVNAGRADGERAVPVTVNGEQVAAVTVGLAPGSSTTLHRAVTLDEPGEYTVSVDGVEAGTVVVEANSTDGGPSATEPEGTLASQDDEQDPAAPTTDAASDDTGESVRGAATVAVVAAASVLVALVLGRRLVAP